MPMQITTYLGPFLTILGLAILGYPHPATAGSESGELVIDGSFEQGTPNPSWEEMSTNFGSPLCDIGCGDAGSQGAADGDWWAWFGGIELPESASVSQEIQGSAIDSCILSFLLEIPVSSGNGTDFLAASVGGVEVFRVMESDDGYEVYAPVIVDVSDQINGTPQELALFSEISGSPTDSSFFVDGVSLHCSLFSDGFESGDASLWTATVP